MFLNRMQLQTIGVGIRFSHFIYSTGAPQYGVIVF